MVRENQAMAACPPRGMRLAYGGGGAALQRACWGPFPLALSKCTERRFPLHRRKLTKQQVRKCHVFLKHKFACIGQILQAEKYCFSSKAQFILPNIRHENRVVRESSSPVHKPASLLT